ncbi:2-methylcitrate dehydratase [Bordetella genomosp. 9]|uniref:2-methylcitrate dehydratase n=1 Tax=Bordetella genomosp. 9 TaxID=1416803 RepID=A0A261R2G4_9BORD|nr:MmgE/PrpD family protein [Bordetella genomosp. 9]OZI18917.1 2-methylcitrate dehydratase [Bordetella genomosp. 9]
MHPIPEDTLVRHVLSLQTRPVSPATRQRLAQALLDWYTAGWSGMPLDAASRLRGLALRCHPGAGTAAVFGGTPDGGTGAGMNAMAAAFANAGIAHLREIDDAHRAAMLHPGIVAVSPVLALAAERHVTQRRAADAIIAGYEVSLRVGEALGTRHAANFHATATAGALGAAAAAGVALGLTAGQLHHALGIAATQAAGLWQLVDDNAHESKSLHPAMAVRNGLTAAHAAQAGFPGARAFFTGKRGMYALLAGDGDIAALDGACDAPERINTATIKAWPCCAQLFTPLDAAQELRQEHAVRAEDIAAVEVTIFPHALKIAGVHWPAKPAEAAFCLRYVVARVLMTGSLTIEDMEAPDLDSAALLALAERITVKTDEQFQQVFPRKRPGRVTLSMRDGRTLSALRELRRGDPELPYDWAGMLARMRAFAPAMDDRAATAIAAWCARLADPAHDAERCDPDPALFTV